MSIVARIPREDDLEALLALDAAYSERHGLESAVSMGALRFFARTEHSFVAERRERGGVNTVGFAFAQAIWTGDRPRLLIERIVGNGAAGGALLAALIKSAYDAGVYDLAITAPNSDEPLAHALTDEGFLTGQGRWFVRVLGSRGERLAEREGSA